MGIQLLSISHKTAPIEIRSMFAFNGEQQGEILSRLVKEGMIQEAVLLSTCNRTELYCVGGRGESCHKVFERMQQALLMEASASGIENIQDYILLYQDDRAVHHLFQVAAGLDSMVIGEDQILGQVKQAHEFSRSQERCGSILNTLFRYAVTCSKKIKTDTVLSKTSVSTASLALKAAEQSLGTLHGKKIMIIGASGKIGGIVLKNAGCIRDLAIYATSRSHSLSMPGQGHLSFQVIPYEERYHYMDEMDVIVSATMSPHFTVTKNHFLRYLKTEKNRVFLDLAVPMDIENSLQLLPGIFYYNIEDMAKLARQNNEKKKADIKEADKMILEYQEQFQKWMVFKEHREDLSGLKEVIVKDALDKGVEMAVDRLFYRIREGMGANQLEDFMEFARRTVMDNKKSPVL